MYVIMKVVNKLKSEVINKIQTVCVYGTPGATGCIIGMVLGISIIAPTCNDA